MRLGRKLDSGFIETTRDPDSVPAQHGQASEPGSGRERLGEGTADSAPTLSRASSRPVEPTAVR